MFFSYCIILIILGSSYNRAIGTEALAIEEFNKAMKLAKSCDDKLKSAEEAIAKLVNNDGEITPFKIDE